MRAVDTQATVANPRLRPDALARWLLAVGAMVVLMVVVGGITRLTESGLSITEWKPVTGAIPPLTQADWLREYELYRQSPQYRYQSGPAGMDLAAFKFIFFWEWFHRLLGRLIGLAFAVPDGCPLPPSLRNIFREYADDLGYPLPAGGDLRPWARQGVLLLNTVLTVRAHEPASHQGRGCRRRLPGRRGGHETCVP